MAGRRAAAGLALAALALTAAGCGLGGTTKTVTVTHTHTVTTTRTVTTTPTTPTAAASCTGGQLSGTFAAVPGSAAAGQISYVLRLANTSQSRCYVSGLPRVELNSLDVLLVTHVVAAGSATGPHVVLAPGASAKATARFSPDVPGPGDSQSGRCQPKSTTLQVTPDGGGTLEAPIQPPTSVCEQGTLNFTVYSAG